MNNNGVYTAEKILSKRVHNGVTQYQIKWKGYSVKDNTWEPVEHIIDRSLLTAFERQERAKKNKRSSNSSSSKLKKLAKDLDNRENSIDNPPATTSKNATVVSSPPPSSPRFEQSTSITSTSTSPAPPKTITPPSPSGDSKIKFSTPPPTTITIAPEPSPPVPEGSTCTEVQVEPIEEISVPHINSNNNSPLRMSTPLPVARIISNTSHDNSIKNRRFTSRFAILNTVITDVTVNDQTITISESKTNHGFFKEVSRHSVAVDTTNSTDCIVELVD